MEGKGLVKFFLVALLLVVIYQFLLILPARSVEKNASNYATEITGNYAPTSTPWKIAETKYLDSISNEKVLNLGVKSYTYEELKKNQMGLGLDLKGGMSVVMQVDLVDLVINMSGKSKDPKFRDAVALAKKNLANAQTDYISLFADAYEELAPNQSLATIFATNPDYRDVINMESTDQEVITEIRKQADETVVRTYEKLKRRIDQFGTMQPNITLDKSVNRIMVELPGINNPERARRILQATAKLEFFPVFQFSEIQNQLSIANNSLKASLGGADYIQDIDSTLMTFDSLNVRNDSFYLANKVQLDKQAESNFGDGPLFSLLTPNGSGQYQPAVIGIANERDKEQINKYLKRKEVTSVVNKNTKFIWKSKPVRNRDTYEYTEDFELYAVNTTKRKGSILEGDKITDAQENVDGQSGGGGGSYVVSLKMNKEGAKIWRKMTSDNLKREVAIVLDDEVVSAPTVQVEIKNGDSQISGDFSVREAQDLANVLKVGKLPAKTEIIQEAIVGPSLGQDNINRSLKALVVGILMVLMFMILYYSTGGIISIIALVANIFFILGTLSSQAMVMTLPGIAGIVLTIGMAVDANVIIFERIREELRDGKSTLAAIRDGFSASYSAIIDANVTTILTAIVLYVFGAGPIVGFAIVLIFGVMFSLFSAVLLTRLIIDWLSDRGTEVKFSTSFSESAFANTNFDFIGKSKTALICSGIFILIGLGSIFTQGFDLGVDFTGGRSYTVKMDKAIDFDKLRNDLTPVFGNETPLVKQFDAANQAEITTKYRINESSDVVNIDSAVRSSLLSGINTYTGQNLTMDQFESGENRILQRSIKIGPTIADDIRSSAFYATIFALLGIFLYILIRFRKWQYGAGAVAALFHDVLVVLGIFSLLWKVLPFSIEIDQAFIAAILTVVGYSINDTVVVFDRIREFFNSYTKKGKEEVINLAVNNTISRTIITSLTTFFVVLMLFIFGGGSIKGFAFALLIGILVGTYSSVFIATPIVNLLTSEADIKTPSTSKDKKGKGYTRKVVTEKK